MHRTVPILLLAGLLATVMAWPPTAPGNNYGFYDDGTRHHKLCYTLTEQGWGVKFSPLPGEWVKITDIEVNLCPPPLDWTYTGKVIIYGDNAGVPDGSDVLWSGTHEVRVGEEWHYIHIPTPVWTNESFYVFHVVDASCSYPQYIYQWFDGTDNAPANTQWYKNQAGVFTLNTTLGDIEIRAKFEAHDVAAVSIESPTSPHYWGENFTPTAYVANVGAYAESNVPVTFTIVGTSYSSTKYVNFPANTTPFLVTFDTDNWDWGTGTFTMRCEVDMTHDWDPTNDVVTEELEVDLRDVACDLINSPIGTVLSGASVTPEGQIYNYGTTTEDFEVEFRIYNRFGVLVYSNSKWVYALGPGDDVPRDFDPWTAGPAGPYTAQCETKLVGDAVPGNDEADRQFTVANTLVDAGAITLISPTGAITRTQRVRLRVEFKNFGSGLASFPARCSLIRPNGTVAGRYTQNVNNLGPGLTATVQFANRRYNQVGTWKVVAWSNLSGDQNRWNDTLYAQFQVVSAQGWGVSEPVPVGFAVNKGAAMTGDGIGKFFLIKGKNSPELYAFDDEMDGPGPIGTVPQDACKVGAGTSIAYLDGKVYLLKANKSFEFYSLEQTSGTWTRLEDLPLGLSGKPARNGSRLIAAEGKLFALKGNKTNEVYCYDPATGHWAALAPMPTGTRAVHDGAALCYSDGRLFAFKGSKTTEFYTYDMASGGWQQLADLPIKAKAGACLVCDAGTMYATFGGNKMGFYSYNVLTNQWSQLEDVLLAPDNRKVRDGAAMTTIEGSVMLVKGKKSEYILAYGTDEVFGTGKEPAQGVMAAPSKGLSQVFVSSPARTVARLSYSFSSPARIQVFSSSGALVRTVSGSRSGAQFRVADLPSGTYVLKIAVGGETLTRQLVVEH